MKLNQSVKNSDGTWNVPVLLFVVAVFLVVGYLMFFLTFSIELQEDGVKAHCAINTTVVKYADMTQIELITELDTGRRTYGTGTGRIACGNFRNTQFGDYHLYAYVKAPLYVVIHTKDQPLVFAQKTEAETRALYEEIVKRMPVNAATRTGA